MRTKRSATPSNMQHRPQPRGAWPALGQKSRASNQAHVITFARYKPASTNPRGLERTEPHQRTAYDHARIATSLVDARGAFTAQIRAHFADELSQRPKARAEDSVLLLDALTAFESWDLLRTTHGRSENQIRRAWATGITALLVPT